MKINQQWVKEQMLQMDGFYAGAKQILMMISHVLEEERKEEVKKTGEGNGND